MTEVTRLLSVIEQGDPKAAAELLPVVYEELRKLAASQLGHEKPGQTLQATALVHEAYLRLVVGDQAQNWNSRGHFFGAAAQAMRRILVDNARRKKAEKHGGHLSRMPTELADDIAIDSDEDLLALDEALVELKTHDPEAEQLVQLRYFTGLDMDQICKLLNLSPATAYRRWQFARAWLHAQIVNNH